MALSQISVELKKILGILFVAFLGIHPGIGQELELLFGKQEDSKLEVFYYPFYDGMQMIEVDYYSGYRLHQLRFHDMGYVPTYPGKSINEYYFRDSMGGITKAFNTETDLDSLSKNLKPLDFINKEDHRTTFWDDYLQSGRIDGHYNVYDSTGQGVIDSMGNVVIPMIYEAIFHKPNCFLVSQGQKWGLISTENYELQVGFFDDFYERDPLIYFAEKGRLLFVYNYENGIKHDLSVWEDVRMLAQGSEGMAWVKQDGKWGLWDYVNDTGVLPFAYDSGNYFSYFYSDETLKTIIVSQNDKFGLISLAHDKPMVLFNCEYDKIYESREKVGPPYRYKSGFITTEKNGQSIEYVVKELRLSELKTE